MAISPPKFCVPPDAVRTCEDECVRGRLTVKWLKASWVAPRLIPARLQAKICFPCTDRQLPAPLQVSEGQVLHVPIVSSPATFHRYLKDLQSIEICIVDVINITGEAFACCVLPLHGFELDEPNTYNLPVHDDMGRCLGHVEVLLEAQFHSLPLQCVTKAADGHDVASSAVSLSAADSNDARSEELLDKIEDEEHNSISDRHRSDIPIRDVLPLVNAAAHRC